MGRAQGKPWEANSFGLPCLWHMPIRGVVYAATINSSSICRNCVFYPLQMQQRNFLTENLLEDLAITAESCSACTACSARRFQRVHHLNNRKSEGSCLLLPIPHSNGVEQRSLVNSLPTVTMAMMYCDYCDVL
jgi:hypothetical protein